MPRKVIKEEEPELVWDKTKLFIAAVILILLIAGGVYLKLFVFKDTGGAGTVMSVKGVSTEAGNDASSHSFSLPTQEDMQAKISKLEQQVTQLNVKDIATSSPEVQKVLKQIQSLPSYPASQAKDMCMKLCGQL